ncbi:MAG TPA: SDR family oxidoreductase [Bacteroidia bacterium]|nr:SDR family oxidoreductase [Bacteroidia bacterium]HNU32223.1 SDR family oxidoreductase [Bacteroidia bacterium]
MTILITGASSGIGYATAIELAVQNHHVIAVARSKDKLENLKKECIKLNAQAGITVVAADISREEGRGAIKDVLNKTGLDVLINNAGYLVTKPFEELTQTDWQEVYQTNVFSLVAVTQMCVPYLQKSKKAHIVNITSMGGVQGSSKFSGLSAYSSSKGAVSILTECLAEELKDKNIAVNALAMGAVETPMLNKAFPGYKAPLTSATAAEFIAWFAVNGRNLFNGKILPVSISTP